MVEGGADADGEGDYGRGEAEGDLRKGGRGDVNQEVSFYWYWGRGERMIIPDRPDCPILAPSYCSSFSSAPQCRP